LCVRDGHVDCSHAAPAACRPANANSNINDLTIIARAIVMPPIIEQFE